MKLFLLILSLSLSGTLIGLLILALRPLTRNYFSAKWNYYIWQQQPYNDEQPDIVIPFG